MNKSSTLASSIQASIIILLMFMILPTSSQTQLRNSQQPSSLDDCSSEMNQVSNWRFVQDTTPRDLVTVDTFVPVHSDLGQPYVDLAGLRYGSSQACIYFQFNLRGKIPQATESVKRIWYQVLLAVGQSSATGYHWSDAFAPGNMLDLEIGYRPGDEPEFSVMRYFGNGSDWSWTPVGGTVQTGVNVTLQGGIRQDFFVVACRYQDLAVNGQSAISFFARSGIRMSNGSAYNDYVPDSGILSMTLPLIATSSSSSTIVQTQTSGVSASATSNQAPLNVGFFPVMPIAGGLIAVAVVAAILLMKRKKGTASQRLAEPLVMRPGLSSQPGISTGYSELDQLLAGGLPEGYSILLLSATWDERDLLLRRIIKSCVSTSKPVFYLSNDMNTIQDLVRAYPKDFYAFSDQADKIKSEHGNLFKIPGIGNLSEFSISLGVALRDAHVALETSKVLVLDTVSDMLLRHKSLTTLRWLSDFVAKRKTEKFTILATLNPLIAAKEETQPIIDLFDGVIQIYEKELAERARRFIVIKKMRGRRYVETDLMLDRNKLF